MTDAARAVLEAPERYPGLAALEPRRRRLMLWRYPSFENWVSWSVFELKDRAVVRRVIWSRIEEIERPEAGTSPSTRPATSGGWPATGKT